MLPLRGALLTSLAALCLVVTLAGCGDSGPARGNEVVGEGEAALTPYLFTNDKAAYEYFVGKGLTNFQAAGIVGNLDQESGSSPTAVQPGGPGRGIAQWSVGGRWDSGTNDNATAYASQHGQSVWSLGLQLDFIWYELTTFSGYGLAKLKQTTNVADATVVFQTDFEGCGTCLQSQRIVFAKAVLAAYGAAPSYAAQFVSQSFPSASSTMTMSEGQVVPAYIELKNVGTQTWDSSTHLATTVPRDRKSAFASAAWPSPSRPAAVKGTVPPGGTYKFAFDLTAPPSAGAHDEHFDVVQEGVAWFSDPGQGGPADNLLEVKIDVVAPKGGPLDAGASGSDGSAGGGEAGSGASGGGAGVTGASGDGNGGAGDGNASASAGCSVAGAPQRDAPAWTLALGLLLALGALTRSPARRRRAGRLPVTVERRGR